MHKITLSTDELINLTLAMRDRLAKLEGEIAMCGDGVSRAYWVQERDEVHALRERLCDLRLPSLE